MLTRSSFATITGALCFLASFMAAASCGRLSSAFDGLHQLSSPSFKVILPRAAATKAGADR